MPSDPTLLGYARVSTTDQDPDLQHRALSAAGCERIWTEHRSDADRHRPEWLALLDHLRLGDTVVVWKLDRFARSLSHFIGTLEELTAKGVGLRSLTEPIDTTSSTVRPQGGGRSAVGATPRRNVASMGSVADTSLRRFLAPDLDGDLFHASEPLDELLLAIANWAEDEDDPSAEQHRDRSDAVGAIRMALNGATFVPLYAPDGRHEHMPLAIIEQPAAVVDAFGAAVAELAAAASGNLGQVDGVVRDFATDRRTTPQALVETAARLHGVCDLAWEVDEERLALRIERGPDGSGRIVLDDAEEAAYRRVRDRLVAMWHDFSGLDRWMY